MDLKRRYKNIRNEWYDINKYQHRICYYRWLFRICGFSGLKKTLNRRPRPYFPSILLHHSILIVLSSSSFLYLLPILFLRRHSPSPSSCCNPLFRRLPLLFLLLTCHSIFLLLLISHLPSVLSSSFLSTPISWGQRVEWRHSVAFCWPQLVGWMRIYRQQMGRNEKIIHLWNSSHKIGKRIQCWWKPLPCLQAAVRVYMPIYRQ